MTGKTHLLISLLLCSLLTGCSTYNRQGPPKFPVEVSFLDHATFTYYRIDRRTSSDPPVLVRIELSGSGHLHYAKGRSSRVHNSFWTHDPDEKHVDDRYTDQIVISEKEVGRAFQSLVDAGVFEKEMQGDQVKDPLNNYLMVHAKINERRGIVITDSREFIKIYEDLVLLFAR